MVGWVSCKAWLVPSIFVQACLPAPRNQILSRADARPIPVAAQAERVVVTRAGSQLVAQHTQQPLPSCRAVWCMRREQNLSTDYLQSETCICSSVAEHFHEPPCLTFHADGSAAVLHVTCGQHVTCHMCLPAAAYCNAVERKCAASPLIKQIPIVRQRHVNWSRPMSGCASSPCSSM